MTQSKCKQVRDLIQEGKLDEQQIADKVGVSIATVKTQRSRLNSMNSTVVLEPVKQQDAQPTKPVENAQDMARYIPKNDGYVSQYLKEFGTSDVKLITSLYKNRNEPKQKFPLLVGDTGCGKTHLARNLAYQLKLPYTRLNLNGATVPEDMVGQMVPSDGENGAKLKWVDGLLTQFMRHGGVLAIDEPNMATADILSLLHSVTDDERRLVLTQKDSEVVFAHPNFFLIATMNPDTYEGTKPLNSALQNRFNMIRMSYSTKVEHKLGVPAKMIEVAKALRKSNDIITPVSTRDLIAYTKNCELYGEKIARSLFINGFDTLGNEANVVRETIELHIDKADQKQEQTAPTSEQGAA